MNTAFRDGRAETLKDQAMGPVQAAVEMNNTPERTVETLKSIPQYVDLFAAAFPGEADPVTFENMARAIEVFEATLVTPGSTFDHFLGGDEGALSNHERQGLEIFMDRGCVACHAGLNAGGAAYFPFGLKEKPDAEILPPEDRGRFEVTRSEGDAYVFKAPALRNVELTAPYFHSGKVWDLSDAVAVMSSAQLGTELTPDEAAAITAFLGSLTGEQPDISYPVLPPHTESTPQPYVEPVPIQEGAAGH